MIVPNSNGTAVGYMREQPVESGFRITASQIVGGFVVPLAFSFYGVYSWATGEAYIIGNN